MKRQHPTDLDTVKRLYYGCHICGTGEDIWSYARNHVNGYFPCRDCYNQHQYWKGDDENYLFYELSKYYRENIDKNYYSFLHDAFCREQFRKSRNEKGFIEPLAYCKGCKKTLPLFDMQQHDGKLMIRNGLIYGGFLCFECVFYLWHPKRKCYNCHRDIYLNYNEAKNDHSLFNLCDSCHSIRIFNKEISAKRESEFRRLRAIESFRHYARSLLINRGIDNPDDAMIDIKISQINMKRTLKQFKKWRKENESNCTDVHGVEQQNEAGYEGAVSSRSDCGSAAGI